MKRLLYALLALAGLGPVPARAIEAATSTVYVLPIRGQIEPALVYVLRRGLAEAQQEKAAAVIFVMDTPGGRLDAATEIVRTIQKVDVPTYTFVEKDAFSAGAIIALATDHIYMAPGSVIGDAMPIMMSPTGGAPAEMPPDVQEKMVSAVSALIRSAAQESGHDPQLAEKMVRRDGEYRIGDEVIAPTNRLLTLTNVEAERMVHRTEGTPEPLLSKGTVEDLNALLERVGLAGAAQKEMHVTQAEKIARFISALAPLLLMAGLLGIYIEIKTPGIGLPGVLGGIALALYFWGHHIAGLAGLEEVALFVIGVVLVVAELIFFPTMGILGVAGAGLMIFSLLLAMIQHFPGTPMMPTLPDLEAPLRQLALGLVLTAAGGAIIGRFLPRITTYSRLALDTASRSADGFTAVPRLDEWVGRTGQTLGALRPSGAALFGEERRDVMTRGEYVEPGRTVRVVAADSGRLVVEEAPS